jgi:MtfA peptidase
VLKSWWMRWQVLARAWRPELSKRRWFGMPPFWRASPLTIDDSLWQQAIKRYDFLSNLSLEDKAHLKTLTTHFLARKEFSGAHGLHITDHMALCIAAQACLPILHIAPQHKPRQALAWYADFVGIVVHPGAMRARRSAVDAAGVAQNWTEDITGEAIDGGPLTLSWQDAAGIQPQEANEAENADPSIGSYPEIPSDTIDLKANAVSPPAMPTAYNVVIHEFAHIMDMRNGAANGCPSLPDHFCGIRSHAKAARYWQSTLAQAFEAQQEAISLHERFGAPAPLLDAYACTNPAEFFAVASEAYFTQRSAFATAYPALLALFDGFYKPTV